MERRDCTVPFLSSAIPELESDVHLIDEAILECEIIADGRNSVFLVVLTLESVDEGGLAHLALPHKADLNELVDVFHNLLFL